MNQPEPHPHTEPQGEPTDVPQFAPQSESNAGTQFAPPPESIAEQQFAPQAEPNAASQFAPPPEPTAQPQPQPHADDTLGRLDLPHEGWRRVSSRYIVVELIGSVIMLLVLAAAAIFLAVITGGAVWQWWVAGPIAVITLIYMVFTPRRVRSIGYLLRDDDLLFRRGIMWQRFVAVPYGRMQLIDVNRGPVARAFGLSELKFVTASATTGVVLPGLPADEADELRDHLVAVAETRRTGL